MVTCADLLSLLPPEECGGPVADGVGDISTGYDGDLTEILAGLLNVVPTPLSGGPFDLAGSSVTPQVELGAEVVAGVVGPLAFPRTFLPWSSCRIVCSIDNNPSPVSSGLDGPFDVDLGRIALARSSAKMADQPAPAHVLALENQPMVASGGATPRTGEKRWTEVR